MSREEMPECCGSGCAVCVLDSWEPAAQVSTGKDDLADQCCGTGCTVCVLDYIQDGSPDSTAGQLSRMLEAIDLAEEILSLKRPEHNVKSCPQTHLDNNRSGCD